MKRFLNLILVLFTVFALTQTLIRWLPGDPAQFLLAQTGLKISVEQLRAEMGLNHSVTHFLPSLLVDWTQGKWGNSLLTGLPVKPQILSHAWTTLKITFLTLTLALAFTLALGLTTQTSLEPYARKWNQLWTALPLPWVAPLFMYLFAVKIPLFSFATSNQPGLSELLMPSLVLAFFLSAAWSRLLRDRLQESLAWGSARAARARGLPEWKVRLKYGIAPVSGVLLAYLGSQTGSLLGGALLTETIFNLHGTGTLLVESALSRDYPVFQAAAFWVACVALLGNTLGDWLQERMSHEP